MTDSLLNLCVLLSSHGSRRGTIGGSRRKLLLAMTSTQIIDDVFVIARGAGFVHRRVILYIY